MQVGVADAGGDDLDQDFARARRRNRHFLDRQRLAECVHHPCFHRCCHACVSNGLRPIHSSKNIGKKNSVVGLDPSVAVHTVSGRLQNHRCPIVKTSLL
jgi:hypothetical protein